MTDLQFTPMESSMFEGHYYDPNSRVLTVKFKSGAIYRHEDVPAEKHAAFAESASPGRYYNENIKGNHVGTKV